jgi:hypothetical protein
VLRPKQETSTDIEARAAETKEDDDGRLELEEQVKDIEDRFHAIKVSPILLSRGAIETLMGVPKMSLSTCAYTSGNVSE